MTKYEIRYYLATGNSPMQIAFIMASDPSTARKIFEQQNPGCKISSVISTAGQK